MNKRIILSAIAVTLLGSAAVLAQGQPAGPQHPMTFFVAREVPGTGNLGGIAGADAICQRLAQGAGAGNHTWHAYLSTNTTAQEVGVNARGRIGPGPWYNAKGQLIAANVADLHGDVNRDRNSIRKDSSLDEHGMPINGVGDMPNEHDMMTGSDSDGRALPGSGHDLQQLDVRRHRSQSDARPFRSTGRRQRVVEFGAYERAIARRRA